MKAKGSSFSTMRFKVVTSWRETTHSTTGFSSIVYAPRAFNWVTPRPISESRREVISCHFADMMKHALLPEKPTMTMSIMRPDTYMLIMAYSACWVPTVKPAATTTTRSNANRKVPTVTVGRRWCTMRASMSVPPVVAPPRSIRPRPMPSITPPNSVPSSMSSVMGLRGSMSMHTLNSAVASRLLKANMRPIYL